MENSSRTGGYRSPAQLIRDADLQGRTENTGRSPYAHPARFEELAEKISKGNRAVADSLLRRWGVRR